MLDEAQLKGLVGWLRHAECFFQGLQLSVAQDRELYIHEVSAQLADYDTPHREMLATFCVDWVDGEMITRASRGESPWVACEVLRATAWRAEKHANNGQAEVLYLQAIEEARRQGANAWELRSALGLATLWAGMGKPEQAAKLLDHTCARTASDSKNSALAQARRLSAQLLSHN